MTDQARMDGKATKVDLRDRLAMEAAAAVGNGECSHVEAIAACTGAAAVMIALLPQNQHEKVAQIMADGMKDQVPARYMDMRKTHDGGSHDH